MRFLLTFSLILSLLGHSLYVESDAAQNDVAQNNAGWSELTEQFESDSQQDDSDNPFSSARPPAKYTHANSSLNTQVTYTCKKPECEPQNAQAPPLNAGYFNVFI